jgi:amino acid adenylation domain-containing protein
METDRDYTHSIPRQFEDVVRRYPDRLAVKMGDRALAYNELNSIANRIAYAINSRRGSRSEPVVLLLDHGIDVIAAIFGVLKAGKFYVVIDPSFPTERIEYIMTDAQPGLVVTNQQYTDLARTQTADRCEFFNIGEIDNSSCPDNFDLDVSPDNLVTIGYTSGSTGAPKGVVATHRTVAQTTGRRALRMGLKIDDRLTLLHSLSFGSGHGHFFISMLNGASLFPFDVKSDGIDRLAQWLKQEKLTVYHSSPSLFRQLAASLTGKKKLSNLRLVHLSGEPITRMDFNLYKDNFGPETLLEFGMGSTEARGIGSAVVDQTFAFPEEGTPIGYPRSHHKVLLIDENGREVRPGEIGEIAVKGPNLNPGYWRKANLTRAKFLSDPTNTIDRTYLTGDLAKMLPDGFLIHMGRKDLMVKIRGYRIEIGEIERALLLHPEVVNAGVAVWDREKGDNYLAAYVVPRLGSALTVSSLTDFLRKKLAGYMIPSVFVFLEALPLINGKLDRKALPKPDGRRPDLGVPYAPPQTETERELSQIWSSILSIDRVGIHDNFFDLGGHSLAASRVISRVIQTFQLELPIIALFDSPTIAEMAAIIGQNRTKLASDVEVARMLGELETMTDEEAEAAVKQLDREGKS